MVKQIPDEFYRIPFKNCGRDFRGCDCWGYVRLVAQTVFDKDFPELPERYEDIKNRAELERLISKHYEKFTRVENPEPGDVVLLRMVGYNAHVGLIINDQDFTHILKKTGVCVERLFSPEWLNRIEGFYRYGK